MPRILMTGAAGRIGTAIAPLLREAGHALTLLDLQQPSAAAPGDLVVIGSVTDAATVQRAARGADLLLHLASYSGEQPWARIREVNVESAHVVLSAARVEAVPVTVLASSVHAAGFVPSDRAGQGMPEARPDTFYGFSKAAMELLASLYADRFGMRIVCARIMTFDDRPRTARARSTWLSPADLVRLIEASFGAPVGSTVVWGVSANARRTVSLEPGRAIGFQPRDDAEDHVAALAADLGLTSPDDIPPVGSEPLGGDFTTRPLGEAW